MNTSILQRLLNRAGASPALVVDGKLGRLTKAALTAFQSRSGLRATGALDERTIQALRVAASAPEAVLPLKRDDEGNLAIGSGAPPPWYLWAIGELGEKETPGPKSNQRIIEYRQIGHTSDDKATEDGSRPWCADFVNAALEASGVRGTRSGMAQSFARSADFVKLDGPALGAIAVFWRGKKTSGQGHVLFYDHETETKVGGIGGNQADSVSRASFGRNAPSFGLLGYWWPKSVPLPKIEPIIGSAPSSNVSMV